MSWFFRKSSDNQLTSTAIPFGKEFREKYFDFGDGVVPLNHGSFGMVPNSVQEARYGHIKENAKFLDLFFKETLFVKVNESRKLVAEVVDCDVEDLVFTANATTALNAVLRSYPFEKGDKIVYCNTIYGSCNNTLKFLGDRFDVEMVPVTLNYPLSHQQIVKAYTDVIDNEVAEGQGKVRMAFFDTVSSSPGCLLPYEELINECRKRGVLSCVDGAHGIGMIPLSLRTSKPDFLTSNLHKWFYAPIPCALLYVDKQHHHQIHTLPISASYHKDDEKMDQSQDRTVLGDEFAYTGTYDYSAIMSVPDAYEFINKTCGGMENIQKYCRTLVKQAGELFAKELGTEIMIGKDLDEVLTNLINVRVPLKVAVEDQGRAGAFIQTNLLNKWKTHIPVFGYNDQLWVRLSGQIYVDLDDFKYGVKAFKTVLNEWKKQNPTSVLE